MDVSYPNVQVDKKKDSKNCTIVFLGISIQFSWRYIDQGIVVMSFQSLKLGSSSQFSSFQFIYKFS